jgi:type I restriction enzyme, S subunit
VSRIQLELKKSRLKFLGSLNMGQSPSSDIVSVYSGNNLPFLQGIAEFGEVYPFPKNACESPPKKANKGDLLISVRAPVGELNLADQDYGIGRGLCSVRWLILDDRFGWWAVHYFRQQLSEVSTGSTYEAVAVEDVANMVMLFPPLEQQKHIAEYLDRETADIDELILEKEKMLDLLEQKRAALVSRAVTQGLNPRVEMKESGLEWLGKIPAHWEVKRLKFALENIEQGWSPQCENTPAAIGQWGVLKVGAVNGWEFEENQNKALPKTIDPIEAYEIKSGDILVSRANTIQLLGSAALVKEVRSRLILCDKLYRLKIDDTLLDSEYLVRFLRSKAGRYALERDASGTSGSMQNIGQDTLKNFWISVPPLEEQRLIIRHIQRETRQTELARLEIERSVQLLRERRSALITAAVTGQLSLEEMVI